LALAKAGLAAQAVVAFQDETRISAESPLPWIELSRPDLNAPHSALPAAEKAVALAPASGEAHEALAKVLEALGKADQAAAESKLAASLAADPAAGKLVAEARIVERYRNPHARAKPNSDADLAQRSWDQAMEEYSSARYAEAAGHLKVWLGAHPENGTGWAMLGLCEFSLDDFENALIHLDRGSQLGLSGSAESVATAKNTFGILLVHAGDFERGEEVLTSANTAAGFSPTVKYTLGLALLRRAEFPRAGSPENLADARADLVVDAGEIAILLQRSQYDDAFLRFKRLLKDHPSTPFLHYAFGTALLALSEFDEASEQMRAEMALSPRSELPLLRLASIALRQRHAREAADWAQSAVSLAPNSAEGHYLLGRASLELGDNATALRELEIADHFDPGSPEVHFNLAKAYDRAHLPEKAEAERAAFSRLNAAMEGQQSVQGSQVYSGPRITEGITTPSAAKSSPSARSQP